MFPDDSDKTIYSIAALIAKANIVPLIQTS
jgi:hypothetical protein